MSKLKRMLLAAAEPGELSPERCVALARRATLDLDHVQILLGVSGPRYGQYIFASDRVGIQPLDDDDQWLLPTERDQIKQLFEESLVLPCTPAELVRFVVASNGDLELPRVFLLYLLVTLIARRNADLMRAHAIASVEAEQMSTTSGQRVLLTSDAGKVLGTASSVAASRAREELVEYLSTLAIPTGLSDNAAVTWFIQQLRAENALEEETARVGAGSCSNIWWDEACGKLRWENPDIGDRNRARRSLWNIMAEARRLSFKRRQKGPGTTPSNAQGPAPRSRGS